MQPRRPSSIIIYLVMFVVRQVTKTREPVSSASTVRASGLDDWGSVLDRGSVSLVAVTFKIGFGEPTVKSVSGDIFPDDVGSSSTFTADVNNEWSCNSTLQGEPCLSYYHRIAFILLRHYIESR